MDTKEDLKKANKNICKFPTTQINFKVFHVCHVFYSMTSQGYTCKTF
jgi:hypothetical protein